MSTSICTRIRLHKHALYRFMGNRKTREKLHHDVGTGCLFSKHTQDKGELDSGYACHFAITLDAVQKIIIHAKTIFGRTIFTLKYIVT